MSAAKRSSLHYREHGFKYYGIGYNDKRDTLLGAAQPVKEIADAPVTGNTGSVPQIAVFIIEESIVNQHYNIIVFFAGL